MGERADAAFSVHCSHVCRIQQWCDTQTASMEHLRFVSIRTASDSVSISLPELSKLTSDGGNISSTCATHDMERTRSETDFRAKVAILD